MWIFSVMLSGCLFAFPYYVAPDILEEVAVNERLYAVSPTSNEVLFDLAMSYAYSGQILNGWTTLKKLDKSYSSVVIDLYTEKMKESPDEWRYPFKLAFGYFFAGEKVKAIQLFEQVLRINPDQVWAVGFIALVYGEMGRVDEAISYCKKGLAMEPNAPGIHLLLAEGYRKKKKYFKAFKHFLIVGRLEAQD